jgi:hypothetical protein
MAFGTVRAPAVNVWRELRGMRGRAGYGADGPRLQMLVSRQGSFFLAGGNFLFDRTADQEGFSIMSVKLSRIRLFKINGMAVIAPRASDTALVRNWFERTEGREVDRIELLSLTARPEPDEPTYAEQIERREFSQDDLPMFL